MILRLFLILLIVIPAIFLAPRLITGLYSRKLIHQIGNSPSARVAIVFGAGLWRDGTPSPVLRDRVATAADLYFDGKVEKLLMSGDNSTMEYNEPAAMRSFALSLGIPDEAIVLDYAGRRTYDTCYRAREIFGAKDVLLVTQNFHLPRALYICNALEIRAAGVSADRRIYHRLSRIIWNLREIPATLNALIEVHVTHPLPILGNPEPIFPQEAQ
jgi:SanA protein